MLSLGNVVAEHGDDVVQYLTVAGHDFSGFNPDVFANAVCDCVILIVDHAGGGNLHCGYVNDIVGWPEGVLCVPVKVLGFIGGQKIFPLTPW